MRSEDENVTKRTLNMKINNYRREKPRKRWVDWVQEHMEEYVYYKEDDDNYMTPI